MDALMSVVSMAVLDVEFLAQTSDVPAVGHSGKQLTGDVGLGSPAVV